mgnify:CR=1 FL=1
MKKTLKLIIILVIFFITFTAIVKAENKEQIDSQNTDLKVLRINYEGMTPTFSKEIKEYYYVTERAIDSLEITAVPENEKAIVTIEGNENLKMGRNAIVIKIVSEDKNHQSEYYIYVTKTNNIGLANSNLETLAIRQGTLEPEFSNEITQYKVEVANDVEKIDLLAIPQSMNASVQISGNDKIEIGDNEIIIRVLAEDKVTEKIYRLTVHRRNEEEQIASEQNQKIQAERVAAILEGKEPNVVKANSENIRNIVVLVITVSAATGIIVVISRKNK